MAHRRMRFDIVRRVDPDGRGNQRVGSIGALSGTAYAPEGRTAAEAPAGQAANRSTVTEWTKCRRTTEQRPGDRVGRRDHVVGDRPGPNRLSTGAASSRPETWLPRWLSGPTARFQWNRLAEASSRSASAVLQGSVPERAVAGGALPFGPPVVSRPKTMASS